MDAAASHDHREIEAFFERPAPRTLDAPPPAVRPLLRSVCFVPRLLDGLLLGVVLLPILLVAASERSALVGTGIVLGAVYGLWRALVTGPMRRRARALLAEGCCVRAPVVAVQRRPMMLKGAWKPVDVFFVALEPPSEGTSSRLRFEVLVDSRRLQSTEQPPALGATALLLTLRGRYWLVGDGVLGPRGALAPMQPVFSNEGDAAAS